MNSNDILTTRIIIAKSIDRSPDNIRPIKSDNKENDMEFYAIDDFRTMNLVVGFNKIPTINEAREEIKDCYLCGCEFEFDFEYNNKYKKSI